MIFSPSLRTTAVLYFKKSPMRPRPSKLGVQMVGRQFIRFIIAADDGTHWTGGGWSQHRSEAMLYAHVGVVQTDLRILKRNRRKSQ